MGKSAPKPPDPVKTAEAQAEFNREAARESALMNQINQVTPWGQQRWTGELGSPDRTQHTILNPLLGEIIFGSGGGMGGQQPQAHPGGKGGGEGNSRQGSGASLAANILAREGGGNPMAGLQQPGDYSQGYGDGGLSYIMALQQQDQQRMAEARAAEEQAMAQQTQQQPQQQSRGGPNHGPNMSAGASYGSFGDAMTGMSHGFSSGNFGVPAANAAIAAKGRTPGGQAIAALQGGQPSAGGGGGGGSGGGCFLTTAVVRGRGEADDGPTLMALRDFRDDYMMQTPERRALVEEYYTIAPAISEAIPEDHEDWQWIEAQVDAAVDAIKTGSENEAFLIYASMVKTLQNRWISRHGMERYRHVRPN